jgi:hypothetical protein
LSLHHQPFQASGIEESYQEARYELEDCEWDVTKASEALRRSAADGVLLSENALQAVQYVKIMQKSITDFAFLGRSTTKNNVGRSAAVDKVEGLSLPPEMISKGELVELHARLKQSHIRARACERRWKHLIRQCEVAEVLRICSAVLCCAVLSCPAESDIFCYYYTCNHYQQLFFLTLLFSTAQYASLQLGRRAQQALSTRAVGV